MPAPRAPCLQGPVHPSSATNETGSASPIKRLRTRPNNFAKVHDHSRVAFRYLGNRFCIFEHR
jgi:hypothetical protein